MKYPGIVTGLVIRIRYSKMKSIRLILVLTFLVNTVPLFAFQTETENVFSDKYFEVTLNELNKRTLTYFDFPKDDWKSIYTSNAIEQHIGKLRGWMSRFSYFRGQTNLDLALYSYVHMKSNEELPSIRRQDQRSELHTFC